MAMALPSRVSVLLLVIIAISSWQFAATFVCPSSDFLGSCDCYEDEPVIDCEETLSDFDLFPIFQSIVAVNGDLGPNFMLSALYVIDSDMVEVPVNATGGLSFQSVVFSGNTNLKSISPTGFGPNTVSVSITTSPLLGLPENFIPLTANLSTYQNLQTLTFNNIGLQEVPSGAFPNPTPLTSLTISGNPNFWQFDSNFMVGLTNLKTLNLKGSNFSNEALEYVTQNLVFLTSLNVAKNPMLTYLGQSAFQNLLDRGAIVTVSPTTCDSREFWICENASRYKPLLSGLDCADETFLDFCADSNFSIPRSVCPLRSHILPCTCDPIQKTIECKNYAEDFDLGGIFGQIAEYTPPGYVFTSFVVMYTGLVNLTTAGNLTFATITLSENPNLIALDPSAFNDATKSLVQTLSITGSPLLGQDSPGLTNFVHQFKNLVTLVLYGVGLEAILPVGTFSAESLPNLYNLDVSGNNLLYLNESIYKPILDRGVTVSVFQSYCNDPSCYMVLDERSDWICHNVKGYANVLHGYTVIGQYKGYGVDITNECYNRAVWPCDYDASLISCRGINPGWNITQTFTNIAQYLTNNKLSTKVQTLRIDGSSITEIPAGAFSILMSDEFYLTGDNIFVNVSLEAFSKEAKNAISMIYISACAALDPGPLFEFLSEFINLQSLTLNNVGAPGPRSGLKNLPSGGFPRPMKRLWIIDLSYNSLSSLNSRALTGLTNVTTLSAYHNNLNNEDLAMDNPLEKMLSLKELNIGSGNPQMTYMDRRVFKNYLNRGGHVTFLPYAWDEVQITMTCDDRSLWLCPHELEYKPLLSGFICADGDIWAYCKKGCT